MRIKRLALPCVALCIALVSGLLPLPASAKPPRLAVLVSVDGLGSDLLLRSMPRLKGGLAQLSQQGAYFPVARYAYAETVTGPGHATLSTGANPWRHGIISNRLVNRGTGRAEPVLADPSHPVLEAPNAVQDVSPENLLAEALADRLRLATQGRGKAIALAGKARGAISLAGRLGQAFWFNETVGRFVTGTFYTKELPPWVRAYNEKKPADALFGKSWELLAAKKDYLGDDDRPFEADWYGLGRAFPHPLNGGLPGPGPQFYSALATSPVLDDFVVQLAKLAVDGEKLGKDEVPDLLAISFSSVDRICHLYGPYSWEAQDAVLRLDKALGELLAFLEKAVGGRDNLVVALSADHGTPAIPEEWAAQGIPSARVNPATFQTSLNKELQTRFNAENLVAGIEDLDVYLNSKVISDKRLDGAAVRRAAAAWLAKQSAVAMAIARDDLFSAVAAPGGHLEALRLGYYPERSGDVLYVPRPFQVMTDEPTGTNHGTPYSYDREVPFVLYGKNVRPGRYRQPASPVDVAPTLASLLEIGSPASAEGTVRAEALDPPPPAKR